MARLKGWGAGKGQTPFEGSAPYRLEALAGISRNPRRDKALTVLDGMTAETLEADRERLRELIAEMA